MSSALTSPGVGQNTNSSTTMAPEEKPAPMSRCRTKCRRLYERCRPLAGSDEAKIKSCLIRFRKCLRHCRR
jgi:hypothetical protein